MKNKIYGLSNEEKWMRHAILLAKKGEKKGEVPIGAVLIHKQKIIGHGWNSCIKKNDISAHAEILAIRTAGQFLNNYRLLNTSLYVTHEPCLMCSAAIFHARITRVIYGSYSIKIDKLTNFFLFIKNKKKHHIKEIISGVLLYECSMLLKMFFKRKRKKIC
ncbi:tRNA adenosine(34) deaminase TadA [Buchnera aphidicola]|uniref:tRNA-specific adenosine deaminase n=1 Tax=Buchnera aphidicola subsp. Tuberolachnus salignus TaxID=98804 RepID=A0A160SYZ2_BUCTT|nr:tRNA adenosine(34) deaminase TadA [Buchnera aphidicola]CUR53146.1 tRNA-specific adenosine deaminase [Buchnera aphidicola (Tuberolachnus salignus)]